MRGRDDDLHEVRRLVCNLDANEGVLFALHQLVAVGVHVRASLQLNPRVFNGHVVATMLADALRLQRGCRNMLSDFDYSWFGRGRGRDVGRRKCHKLRRNTEEDRNQN